MRILTPQSAGGVPRGGEEWGGGGARGARGSRLAVFFLVRQSLPKRGSRSIRCYEGKHAKTKEFGTPHPTGTHATHGHTPMHQARDWTFAEDTLLRELVIRHTDHSTHWNLIAPFFHGRTTGSIRNRFLRVTRTNHRSPPKHRCRHCGSFRRGHTCVESLYCPERLSSSEDGGESDTVAVPVAAPVPVAPPDRSPLPLGTSVLLRAAHMSTYSTT